EHRRSRYHLTRLHGRAQPLVGVRRRHPHVHDRHVRPVRDDRLYQRRPIADHGDHLVPVLGQQPDEALPQQYRVVGHDYPHGSSARISVGPPAGLTTSSVPPVARTRSASPASPCPLARCAPPWPSSTTATCSRAPTWPTATAQVLARLCLATLVSASATTKYAVLSTIAGSRPSFGSTDRLTGITPRAASAASAAARPRSLRIGGALPRGRARSSSSASRVWPSASSRISRAAAGSVSSCWRARPRSMASRASRCCGPSWMSRSSRRSAVASAETAESRCSDSSVTCCCISATPLSRARL